MIAFTAGWLSTSGSKELRSLLFTCSVTGTVSPVAETERITALGGTVRNMQATKRHTNDIDLGFSAFVFKTKQQRHRYTYRVSTPKLLTNLITINILQKIKDFSLMKKFFLLKIEQNN